MPFPPERELAARFGVARETVRQALHELLVEGRIERRGRGTVVSKPKLVQPLSLRSYTEGALQMGRKPGRLLVTWEDVEATRRSGRGPRRSPTATPSCTWSACCSPTASASGWRAPTCRRHRFGAFTETFDPTTSLYAAIRATGVEFGSAVERVETVLASPREAGLLESTTAMPMLRLNRRSLDTDGPADRGGRARCTAVTAWRSRHCSTTVIRRAGTADSSVGAWPTSIPICAASARLIPRSMSRPTRCRCHPRGGSA